MSFLDNWMKETIIRDPIYGFIDLSYYPFIKKIIDTAYFQRLRRLSQLGVSVFVYPSATHNRFNHSLGAMQLFVKLYDHLFREIKKTDIDTYEKLRKTGLTAGLLHDIGHGPFSHVAESIFKFKHESLSKKIIIEDMKEILENDVKIEDVISVIDNTIGNEMKILSQLISSTLDVDRLDYLARDIYFTGVGFGSVDLERIIRTMTIYNDKKSFLDGYVVIEEKGKRSIETLLLTRDVMYSDLYYHKTTRGIEVLLKLLFKRVKILSESSQFQLPEELMFMKREQITKNDIFCLDDHYVYSLLLKWSQGHYDYIVNNLSKRIINRNLFKAIEYPIGTKIVSLAKYDEQIKELLSNEGLDPDYYYYIDEPEDRPYSPILSPTNEEEQQQALKKNIYIKLHNSKCVEISQESNIIKTMTERESLTRLYVPAELRSKVEKILNQSL